jgi:hypothetical protein
MKRVRLVALLALAVLFSAPPLGAHEIPSDVIVQAFVKPEGQRLRLLLRVPLAAMRDVEFPVVGPGYLDLARLDPYLREAAMTWLAGFVHVYEQGRPLPQMELVSARVSIPADGAFRSYAEALALMQGPPLPADSTELVREQAAFDVLFEVPITSAESAFSIEPEFARLGVRTTTVLRFLAPGHGERVFQFDGDVGLVQLDPSWLQASLLFVKRGFVHILDGIDHLLFLFCLVIPFRRVRPLIGLVTAFTVAHSITLAASTLGFAPDALWFPPLIETLIALSIVYMALENIVGARLERRWLVAFAFGLVHGFGFSFFLRESLQFAGSHLALSLVSFNVGVELGQLLLILAAVPVLNALFKMRLGERMGTIILSAFAAHTAWHWSGDRYAALRSFPFEMPSLDAHLLASLMRGTMALLVVGGVAWGLGGALRRLLRESPTQAGESATAGAD